MKCPNRDNFFFSSKRSNRTILGGPFRDRAKLCIDTGEIELEIEPETLIGAHAKSQTDTTQVTLYLFLQIVNRISVCQKKCGIL